ncbi:MAG: transcriptional regulator, TetR family [Moraxellaceae bacterium]|jgi:AcrR family transcriptional regulator|nr:transcriptional regulator, TetR family [Moraxellaceae bacterium]
MAKPAAPRPTTGPGSKERGKTRALLIEAGLHLFSRKGFDGVSVAELEAAVGLKAGSGSFYRHFSDKEALLKALMEQEIESARARRSHELDALADADRDTRSALLAQFRLTLRGMRDNLERANLLSRGAEHFPELKAEVRQRLVQDALESIARVYRQRIQAGELIDVDPQALAVVVQNALYGYAVAEAGFGSPADPQAEDDAFVNAMVSMLLREGR